MKITYIFDVDGTLTPSRQKIRPDFEEWFFNWIQDKTVHLATGSDYPKTQEQLSDRILNSIDTIFCCAGNSIWKDREEIYSREFKLPNPCYQFLYERLSLNSFPLRLGNHFDYRPGMVNFSILGRQATLGERILYQKWDTKHNERVCYATMFNNRFNPKYTAQVAGETGIDIYEEGYDKSKILQYLDAESIYFIGDDMQSLGNDYSLKKAIEQRNNSNDKCVEVSSWEDTQRILENETRMS